MPEDRGFLLIDKPAGITSFDVIRSLRRVCHIRRIGHCGTLDPFATGLLICAVGSYTRLISMLEEMPKTYRAIAKLGEQSSTGDTEGDITVLGEVPGPDGIPEDLIGAALGITELSVPAHSAVKIDGKRAYSLARQGKELNMPFRSVRVHAFRIDSWEPPYLTYTCTVSKGTYIRSLTEWLAARLDAVAHTVELRRLAIGDASVEDATTLEALSSSDVRDHFVLPEKLFHHLQMFHADADTLRSLRNGQSVADPGVDAERVIVLAADGSIACVAARRDGFMNPRINIV